MASRDTGEGAVALVAKWALGLGTPHGEAIRGGACVSYKVRVSIMAVDPSPSLKALHLIQRPELMDPSS